MTADNLITRSEFVNAVVSAGYAEPASDQYDGMCAAAPMGNISSTKDLAQFLAQVLWESDGLAAKEEHAAAADPVQARDSYDAGPSGQVYWGRGYIRLTWGDNYRSASKDIFGDDRLYRDPQSVVVDEYTAWAVSYWYWRQNVACAAGYGTGFGYTTKVLSGGLECTGGDSSKARKRYEIYTKVATALGQTPLGPEGCYS